MTVIREAKIRAEFHRHLQNAMDAGTSFFGITFKRSEPGYSEGLEGEADIVIFDDQNKPWLVIETKKLTPKGPTEDFDPYSPKVVKQAYGYAHQLGTPFFSTFNGKMLVLFLTFEEFKPLLQRKTKSYLVKDLAKFAPELLREIANLHKKVSKWDSRDESFVSRIRTFHSQIFPHLLKSLNNTLQKPDFKSDFEKWMKDQGWDISKMKQNRRENLFRNFTAQIGYLLMNKIVFSLILESEPIYNAIIPPLRISPFLSVSQELKTHFEKIIKKADFEAIFEHDEIYGRIPFSTIEMQIREFIEELRTYDLSQFDSDVIGRIYESVIPPQERHDLGQYYTPTAIVELLVRLTVVNPNDEILDPAVGSGGFVVKAYNRLKELKNERSLSATHKEILSQIYGIDINRFPAHLTAINLAIRDLSSRTTNVCVEIRDFFNVISGTQRFAYRTAGLKGEKTEFILNIPSKVDVVVANPPYIRQRMLDKQKVRAHLESIGLEESIDARSDIYVYFFTHAFEFLKEKGRIGFITSDRWLFVKYGEALQGFFLDNFRIKAIIRFDRQVFEESLIDTCVTILEKEASQNFRDKNIVRFVRIKMSMDIDDIIDLVQANYDPEVLYETKKYRVVSKSQKLLKKEKKWHRFFFASTIYFEILKHKKMTKLGDIADLKRGLMTGVNEFFYFKKEDAKSLGIEEKFVTSLIKGIGQIERIELREGDTDWGVLDVHDLVEEILSSTNKKKGIEGREDQELSGLVKREIQRKGYLNLYKYILLGESKNFHKRSSVESRRVWFDLGDLARPPLLFPAEYWRKSFVIYNRDRLTLDKRFYELNPKDDINLELLAGIMNSDLTPLFREMHGRTASGEGMNRNEVMVYEAIELPTLNPRKLTRIERDRIVQTFKDLLRKEVTCTREELAKLRRRLNEAVLAPLGMENRVEELEKAVDALLEIRIKGRGLDTAVLVEIEEEEKVLKLEGARLVETTSLDEFSKKLNSDS